MLRATEKIDAPVQAEDSVILDYDGRQRRRLAMTTVAGEDFLLDLPRPMALADGDGLRLEDGRVVRVQAAAEALIEVKAGPGTTLTELAWHLGNRHLPTAVTPDALFIRPDAVIEAMLRMLGAHTAGVERPFTPLKGAYGKAGGHGHAGEHKRGHSGGHSDGHSDVGGDAPHRHPHEDLHHHG